MAKKNSKKTVPELRFRGFTDPWEQRQLGEVVQIVGGGTPDSSNADYWDGDIDWYTPSEIGERRSVETSARKITPEGLVHSSARLLPAGSILFTSRASIGLMAFISRPSATNQGFQSLVPSNNVDSNFLYALGPYISRYAKKHAAGSTFIEISGSSLAKAPLRIPSLAEQRRIGEFFTTLDSLIAAAERQEVLLRQKKQVYLQLMFPREGETQPRLRFAGFSGEWQQRQLGELGSAISGVGFPDAEQGGAGGLPFYKVSDMNLSGNELVMSASSNYVSAEQVMKNHWKPITTIPAIIFAKVGAAVFLDRKRVAATPFLMDNNMMAYIPNGKSWDVDFCLSVFNRIRLSNLARIGALPSINASDVEQHHIALPGLPEQHHIGSFFSTLDNLIAASEKRTASFRALKSAYLQRMFV